MPGIATSTTRRGGFRDRLGSDLADKLRDVLADREACHRTGALDVGKHGTADELRRYVDELLADDRKEDARDLVRQHYDAAVRGELLAVEGERA